MTNDKKGAFAPNSVLEGAGFFIALFLILVVLVPFLFFPTGVAKAASSEKSLLGLERNIERIVREDTFAFDFPLSIGDNIWFVSFSKGDSSDSTRTRPPACKSYVKFSCLCMCKDEKCEVAVQCSDFKDFNNILMEMEVSGNSVRAIEGDGNIVQLFVSESVISSSEKNLHIRVS